MIFLEQPKVLTAFQVLSRRGAVVKGVEHISINLIGTGSSPAGCTSRNHGWYFNLVMRPE